MIRNIYQQEDIVSMEDDDSLNSIEAAFMEGYNEEALA